MIREFSEAWNGFLGRLACGLGREVFGMIRVKKGIKTKGLCRGVYGGAWSKLTMAKNNIPSRMSMRCQDRKQAYNMSTRVMPHASN